MKAVTPTRFLGDENLGPEYEKQLDATMDRLEALPVVKDAHIDTRKRRVIANLWCGSTHPAGTMRQPPVSLNKKHIDDPAAVPSYLVAAERLISKIEKEHAACSAAAEVAKAAATRGSADTGATTAEASVNPFAAMMELRSFEQRVEAAKKAEFEAARATKAAMEALDEKKAALYGRAAKAARTEADEDDVRWERWTYHDWTYQERKAAERRGVELRADANVLPPRDGQHGFLHHPRRGGVGWVQDWARGSLHWAVFMILALIRHLNIVEKVRAGLPKSKAQREAETNAKIVDLLEQGLAETKHCRSEQQRQEFHIGLGYVMPPRLAHGWYARICARLKVQRGKRSEARGARPYAADQAVDRRAQFDKDVVCMPCHASCKNELILAYLTGKLANFLRGALPRTPLGLAPQTPQKG